MYVFVGCDWLDINKLNYNTNWDGMSKNDKFRILDTSDGVLEELTYTEVETLFRYKHVPIMGIRFKDGCLQCDTKFFNGICGGVHGFVEADSSFFDKCGYIVVNGVRHTYSTKQMFLEYDGVKVMDDVVEVFMLYAYRLGSITVLRHAACKEGKSYAFFLLTALFDSDGELSALFSSLDNVEFIRNWAVYSKFKSFEMRW